MLGNEGSNRVIDYQVLLRRGFRLSWISSNCSDCAESGGRCGFDVNNYQFKCFCTDRPHASSCPPTKAKRNLGRILGTVFSCIGVVILLFCLRKKIFWHKNLRFWESIAEDQRNIEAFLKNTGSYAPKRYSYTDIKRITNHFKLGQGGFGNVYRGNLRNGSQVAVKILNELKGNGEDFINEVASISRTSHVNIVSLVGFCFEGHKRALLYEFMPNGSLEKFIYEEISDGVRQLGWQILYEIALGIARGLEYLHRGCNTRILHFDIKPHNILLDEDICPKISDFGLAKLCIKKESIVSINLGGVSHKSDVYSYGMMVLEMVGGRKNVDVGVDRTNEELQLIGIMNEEENKCARKMVIASLWCIQTDPANRPSMSKVVEMLEGKLDSLQMPPKPYLYSPSRPECIHREGQCQSDSKNDFFCSKAKAGKRYLGLILGIGSFAVFTCIGIVNLLFCFREKILWYKCLRFWESKAEDHRNIEAFLKNSGSYAPKRYNYTDIKQITSHFKIKLGQGGFGNVYRGCLRDGSQVAVKVLNELKGSGEDFINEVASISRTSHVNIVRLVGFCFEGHKRALIYEFMPNGSLEKFIYEERSDGVRQLGWPILYEISLGIARGLEYLHRGCTT
ncbi:hypothetical protein KY289_026054 [Solanum tuberosum]|nr:hypothetical protein KY289_026054 [Solanum tuberosum]